MFGWFAAKRGPDAARRLVADGSAHEREGRPEKACAAYEAAVRADPDYMPARLNLGAVQESLARVDEAARTYQDALTLEPTNPFAAYNLGRLALQRGDLPRAMQLVAIATRHKPDFADAHVVQAGVHEALGDAAAALRSLEAALEARPGYVGALRNLGILHARLHNWDAAAFALREAVQADPVDPELRYWLGRALHHLGKPNEAAECLQEAVRTRPDEAEFHSYLGNLLCELGRTAEARPHLSRAISLQPSLAEAHIGLGHVFASEKLLGEAVRCYRKAVELAPDLLHVHINLGNALVNLGETAEGRSSYDAALAIDPENAGARWCRALATIPAVRESHEELLNSRAAFAEELAGLEQWFAGPRVRIGHHVVGLRQPFWLAYQEEPNVELLRRYGQLCTRLMAEGLSQKLPSRSSIRAPGRIRVGIVSQYFRDHSVWNAIVKGWFRQLDPDRFEIAAFSLGIAEDAQTALARSRAERFESGHVGLEAWIGAIAAARPDVLIYPEIGMDPMAVRLAALRLAPLQMASWGHPETSGLPTIDGYLSAEVLEPENAQSNYTEELVLLPNLGCHVEPEEKAPALRLDELGLDHDTPLLVCPGTPFKYAPEHDHVLVRIAQELGRCRLLFFEYVTRELSARLLRRLTAAFAREGMDAGQYIRMLPWLTRPAFLGLMTHADAYLDTIGFSGFNTALQAIQCNLPVVSMEGRFLRGRLASGILRQMAMEDTVARSSDDYVALAVRICRDSAHRSALVARMATASPRLFGDPAPVRALEQLLFARIA